MKIAHVINYFQPKLGYQEFYLAKEQQKIGHEVCVIASDRYAPFPNYSETVGKVLGDRYVGQGTFIEEGLTVIRLPLIFEFASNVFLLGLKKVLAIFHPDVVHAHGVTSPITLETIILKDLLQYKLFFDCHADYLNQSKSLLRWLIFNLIAKNPFHRYLYRRADGYIAVAESSHIWLSKELGIPYDKIEVIPLGADSNLFSPNVSKRRIMRDKLGVSKDDVLIVYAGKIVPEKDIEVLLEASGPLINKHRNVKILLIGSGPKEYTTKLRQIMEKYKITKNVLYYPFQHKTVLPNFYNAGDIGVWPGSDSITILEAIATGLPVIIPRSYRNLHYIEYRNGFNFTRGNSKELKNCLEILIVDEELREKMSLKSYKLVEEKLNWNVITKQTVDLYQKVRAQ